MTPREPSLLARYDRAAIPLALVVRLFLGGYFIYTGFTKILDPVAFLKAVRLFDLLPESPAVYLNGTAVVLPWLEVICGVALVLGLFRRGAAALIAGMLCVFTPAIFLRALAMMKTDGLSFFEVEFDCGCGTGHEIIWIKLCKNTGLFLLAVAALASRSTCLCASSLFDRGKAPAAGGDLQTGASSDRRSGSAII